MPAVDKTFMRPASERATKNESKAGAFGVPELRSPVTMGFQSKFSRARPADAPPPHESSAGALGIPEFRSPDGDELLKKNAVCCLLWLHTALLYVSHFSS